jgi:phospholipid transport system substrate-binding protein
MSPLTKKYQGAEMVQRRIATLIPWLHRAITAVLLVVVAALVLPVQASQQAPDVFMQQLSNELLDVVRKDPAVKAGDMQKLANLVDTRVLPNVNFQRMTASAVGPAWRQASPEQQKRLQEEFKLLLVRSYAGALSQAKESHTIVVKGFKGSAEDNEVVVRSEIRGGNEPIPIDYRLEKNADAPGGWKIYNFNVLGVWLVDNYRTQFAQEINAKGVDGLIATLTERNKSNSRK